MLTLNEKHRNDVKLAKKVIDDLTTKQNNVMEELALKVGVKEGSDEYDFLWDHVFNDTRWTVKYSKKVE